MKPDSPHNLRELIGIAIIIAVLSLFRWHDDALRLRCGVEIHTTADAGRP